MKKWVRDMVYGVVILIIAVILIIDTYSLKEDFIPYESAKAGIYSRFWLYVLLVLTLIMILRAVIVRDQTKVESLLSSTPWVTVIMISCYLLVIKKLGFVLSTILFLMISMTYYTYKSNKFQETDGKWRPKKEILRTIVFLAVCSAGVTVATFFLFTKGAKVLLPTMRLW